MSTPYLYGSNAEDSKLQDVLKIKKKMFDIDFGAQGTGTDTTVSFPADSIILTFNANVTEAATSSSGMNVSCGFTGTTMMSDVIAKASVTLASDIGPNCDGTEYYAPIYLTAADTFDVTIATTAATAGKLNVVVWYIESPAFDSEVSFVTA